MTHSQSALSSNQFKRLFRFFLLRQEPWILSQSSTIAERMKGDVLRYRDSRLHHYPIRALEKAHFPHAERLREDFQGIAEAIQRHYRPQTYWICTIGSFQTNDLHYAAAFALRNALPDEHMPCHVYLLQNLQDMVSQKTLFLVAHHLNSSNFLLRKVAYLKRRWKANGLPERPMRLILAFARAEQRPFLDSLGMPYEVLHWLEPQQLVLPYFWQRAYPNCIRYT